MSGLTNESIVFQVVEETECEDEVDQMVDGWTKCYSVYIYVCISMFRIVIVCQLKIVQKKIK